MVHACHAPMAIGFLAHGHAPSAQPAPRRIDGEFVLVPHCFANGVKRAFMNLQPRRGRLMKIALVNITILRSRQLAKVFSSDSLNALVHRAVSRCISEARAAS